MSKEQFQLSLFSTLKEFSDSSITSSLIGYHSKLSRDCYLKSFVTLTKAFCHDELEVDDYKKMLHTLVENYRKDFRNGNAS